MYFIASMPLHFIFRVLVYALKMDRTRQRQIGNTAKSMRKN